MVGSGSGLGFQGTHSFSEVSSGSSSSEIWGGGGSTLEVVLWIEIEKHNIKKTLAKDLRHRTSITNEHYYIFIILKHIIACTIHISEIILKLSLNRFFKVFRN